MEFFDFATTDDYARRLGLTDEPAFRFCKELQVGPFVAHQTVIQT